MKKQIKKAIIQLEKAKIILYPTDTVWGIGCDATSEEAVKKIYQLKQREESKSLIVLVDSLEMLQTYVANIPNEIKAYLIKITEPTTVIYSNPKNLAKNTIAKDNTIAIRIVKKGFAYHLISAFKKPIIATSANISNTKTPMHFDEISTNLKNKIDFIVWYNQDKKAVKPSKIIRFAENKIVILRD